jgi:transcriptional regulator with XRE-family HTH domain
METFAQRLKRLRTEKGWSIRKLAKRAGVSYESVRMWELGRYEPSLFLGECVAEALGVSYDYLTWGEELRD